MHGESNAVCGNRAVHHRDAVNNERGWKATASARRAPRSLSPSRVTRQVALCLALLQRFEYRCFIDAGTRTPDEGAATAGSDPVTDEFVAGSEIQTTGVEACGVAALPGALPEIARIQTRRKPFASFVLPSVYLTHTVARVFTTAIWPAPAGRTVLPERTGAPTR